MGDSLITVVTIILAAILLFVFPMMTLADRTDDISIVAVQTATVDFVNETVAIGKITQDNYSKYIQTITSTGNTYTVNLELRRLDENPSKKSANANTEEVGEKIYYTLYTTQIEEKLNNDEGVIYLKQGDSFYAEAINNNQTLAEVLKGLFYKVTGENPNTITGKHTGIVISGGQ